MGTLKHTIGCICFSALLAFVSCTSDLDSIQAENQTDSQGKGITATVVLPGHVSSKTIDVVSTDTSAPAIYTVTLGDQTQDGTGEVAFTGLNVGEYTLTVTGYEDTAKTKPLEYKSETVSVLAGSSNEFNVSLEYIYKDTSDEFSTLTGTVSIDIDWSDTKNSSVRYIQLIDNSKAEGENVLASQSVESGAMSASFSQEVGVTNKQGSYVHFRFLGDGDMELGTSQLEVLRVAANQTSHLVDPLNNGSVSTLLLNANALNAGKGVSNASFAYTKNSGELKLTWKMPSSYSGLTVKFYADGDAAHATTTTYDKSELTGMNGNWEQTFDNLTPGTTYYAELVVLHNDDGVEYESGSVTTSQMAPIPLTGMTINELSSGNLLEKGRTVNYTITTEPVEATDLGYTWSSSDESILSVEDEKLGTFRVKGYGKATITVQSDVYDVNATKDVIVKLGQVYNVTARASSNKILVSWTKNGYADSYTLVKYADEVEQKTVTDITSNSWEDTELVTGVRYQYEVQANKSINGVDVSGDFSQKSATISPTEPTVLISGATAESVIASSQGLSGTELVKGGSITISLAEEVENITSYKWLLNGTWIDNKLHTSGKDIITIDSGTSGLLSSKAGQVQTLTLIMNDGEKDYSANFQFTYVSVPVASIVIDTSLTSVTRGKAAKLSAHVEPLDADVQTFTWKSSNESLATIDSDGNITVASDMSAFTDDERKVTFTATSTSNESISASTSEITLVAPVESISITNAARTLFVGGKNGFATEKLVVSYLPNDTSESEKTIVGAYSSNNGVLTVDSDLQVTATGPGSATVTVEGKNGTQATWTPTTVLQGHILEYQSKTKYYEFPKTKTKTTTLNAYVEGTTVSTTGYAGDGNEYYFRVIYTNSNSGTPDSSTFQDLASLGLSISYVFTDGNTSHGAAGTRYDLKSVDSYAFYVLRQADTDSSGVNVTVYGTLNGNKTELETLSFSTSH